MPEKKSNKLVNIIITVVIVGLFLTGVYLINESIRDIDSDSEEETTELADNNQASEGEEEITEEGTEENTNESQDIEEGTNDPTLEEGGAEDANDESENEEGVEAEDKVTDETSENTEEENTKEDTEENEEVELASGQVVATVISIQSSNDPNVPNRAKIKVLASGIKDAKFLVAGRELTLNYFRLGVQSGKTYQITGFSESDSSYSLSNASTVEVNPADYQ